MLRVLLGTHTTASAPLRVLAVGAHPDDIEIGCGGTLLRLAEEHPRITLRWLVLSGPGERRAEADASARGLFADTTELTVEIHRFRDGYFPYQGAALKDVFEALRLSFEPDLILTSRREDLHQDHRLVGELTWQTFRDHLILEYEIAKYEGDIGPANVLVSLDEAICQRKVEHLLAAFPSQSGRQWFTADSFWGLLRLRGIEAGSTARFAEGFTCRKAVL